MSKVSRLLWSAVVSRLVVASAAGAVEVHVDFDPAVDFSRYRSIGWLEGTAAADPTLERKVHASIERELIPNGLREIREAPDLLLVTHAALESERTVDVTAFEYWQNYSGWKRPLAVSRDEYAIPRGMLIVDMIDAATGKLIWRGVATGNVAKKREKRDEKLDESMAKLFRSFPPRYKQPA